MFISYLLTIKANIWNPLRNVRMVKLMLCQLDFHSMGVFFTLHIGKLQTEIASFFFFSLTLKTF